MKKILLVDLDDTLLSFRKASDASIRDIFDKYNVPFTVENLDLYEKINQYYWQKYERKEISREVILAERFHTFLGNFGVETDGKEENAHYAKGLQERIFFIDNAMEFLDKCKELGMKICLISNGVNSVQVPRLDKSKIGDKLDKRYISELVGYAKPDINFFEAIFKDFPNQREDMVVLGDSLTSDIQGGINANITTVWFNPKHKESDLPDYQIDKLMDFFSLDIMK